MTENYGLSQLKSILSDSRHQSLSRLLLTLNIYALDMSLGVQIKCLKVTCTNCAENGLETFRDKVLKSV